MSYLIMVLSFGCIWYFMIFRKNKNSKRLNLENEKKKAESHSSFIQLRIQNIDRADIDIIKKCKEYLFYSARQKSYKLLLIVSSCFAGLFVLVFPSMSMIDNMNLNDYAFLPILLFVMSIIGVICCISFGLKMKDANDNCVIRSFYICGYQNEKSIARCPLSSVQAVYCAEQIAKSVISDEDCSTIIKEVNKKVIFTSILSVVLVIIAFAILMSSITGGGNSEFDDVFNKDPNNWSDDEKDYVNDLFDWMKENN